MWLHDTTAQYVLLLYSVSTLLTNKCGLVPFSVGHTFFFAARSTEPRGIHKVRQHFLLLPTLPSPGSFSSIFDPSPLKSADVIYGRPPSEASIAHFSIFQSRRLLVKLSELKKKKKTRVRIMIRLQHWRRLLPFVEISDYDRR